MEIALAVALWLLLVARVQFLGQILLCHLLPCFDIPRPGFQESIHQSICKDAGLTHSPPHAPQTWGELDLVPPKVGGLGGLIDRYCVSPGMVISVSDDANTQVVVRESWKVG
jgi:hypothetical protein